MPKLSIEGCRVVPDDAVIYHCERVGQPLRWNIDQIGEAPAVVYYPLLPGASEGSNAYAYGKYVVRAPDPSDPRSIYVYANVHRNEAAQAHIARSLEEDPNCDAKVYDVNGFAKLGQRQRRHNMNLIFPGNPHGTGESLLAHLALRHAGLWNPDLILEMHDTPLADDALIYMRRDVGRYVGRVAAWFAREYDMPIVEAGPAMFSGNCKRSLLVEMPVGDPRFSVDSWRKCISDLIANSIDLPDEPALPQFSFWGDIPRTEWLATGEDTSPRKAFSLIPPRAAKVLKLPEGSRVINWVGGKHAYPGVAIVPFGPSSNPHNRDARRLPVGNALGVLHLAKPVVPIQ